VIFSGLATVALGFGSFLAWGFVAPLDSAAIAPGVVAVHSQRKTVEHLEGGIVKAIHVEDGDQVAEGDLLVELDATASEAQLNQIDSQLLAQRARAMRLHAEQSDARELEFPPRLLTASEKDPMLVNLIMTERRIFESRWKTYDGRKAVNGARISQLEHEIRALAAQASARREQIGIREKELAKLERLARKGFEGNARIVEQRVEIAELKGERAELLARAAKARQGIKETELSTLSLGNERLDEIYAELKAAQETLADLADRHRAIQDVVRRTRILAPQDGKVTNLQIVTVGGVIRPGEPVLDIVPSNDELIVEAMLDPADIDSVRPGLLTQVRLTAYRRRVTPTVDGYISHVSADMLTDERSGNPYFLAKVSLDLEGDDVVDSVELYPGMPAEVVIVTGTRKAIDYFIAPITDSMSRAMREE
jgi:HlyD family secretion protein